MSASLNIKSVLKEGGDIALVLGIMGIVLLMIIPLPPFLLDVLITISMTFSVLIFLVSFYARQPLEFSVFPTMILLSTLLRLTLNIASTRLILLHGGQGDGAAGDIIRAFGFFVAGGNYVVGLVVFIILVVINFVVITKGAGRIAEVAARFTLDSMPGKQLAIDADLNAGIITDKEALRRREELGQQADFYGSMDGASKFVRGDAIAGIIITVVNIVGGFIIGMAQEGMSLVEAGKIYTILSIGDGLVSQLPALIVSTAAGLIVTKVASKQKLSDEIGDQTVRQWRPMAMAAVVMFFIGLLPGLPRIPFIAISGALGWVSYRVFQTAKNKALKETSDNLPKESVSEQVDNVPPLDTMEIEVGYDLVSLVDQNSQGEFPSRILGIRRQLAHDMGILLPPVHIRDNLKLKSNEYKIHLKGAVVGQGELLPHHLLALDPGHVSKKIEGIPTQDPTFGLPALWIPEEQKETASISGYTVVDLASVMATHLIEVVRRNLHEVFGRQELSKLMDQIKVTHARVVNDLVPELLPFGTVLKVIQNLLSEQVSVRNMVTILEALAESAGKTKDAQELTEYVRIALGRPISQHYAGSDQTLYAITLSRAVEEKLRQSVSGSPTGQLAIDPNLARHIVEKLGEEAKRHLGKNQPPVVLTSQQIRPHLHRLIERFIPNLPVLAHSEVAGHVRVDPVGMVGLIGEAI